MLLLLQGPGSGELATAQITQCVPANPAILDAVPDLTSLTYLNEPSILHDLNQRCASACGSPRAGQPRDDQLCCMQPAPGINLLPQLAACRRTYTGHHPCRLPYLATIRACL